ncbi:MAG: hypothetical protein WCD81_10420 [Candidatus Bathyarchaeia archaeon]
MSKNEFTTVSKLWDPPRPTTLQQRWERWLRDNSYGNGSEHARRFPVDGTVRFFYDPNPVTLKVGDNVVLGLDEAVQPVRLLVNATFNKVSGDGGVKVTVEKATLKELGLDEKSLNILVRRILAGGD